MICAACRGRSGADWVDKIARIAEEADETLLWLELIQEGGLVCEQRLSGLREEADDLTALFTSFHRAWKSQIKNPYS